MIETNNFSQKDTVLKNDDEFWPLTALIQVSPSFV